MKFIPIGARVQRLPEWRGVGGWDAGDRVFTVVGKSSRGWLRLNGYADGVPVCPDRFRVVTDQLARDELYMRLRNDAKLTHQQALDFIAECPDYAQIRHCLDNLPNTGNVMAALVIWQGKNEEAYRDGARRCGWGY